MSEQALLPLLLFSARLPAAVVAALLSMTVTVPCLPLGCLPLGCLPLGCLSAVLLPSSLFISKGGSA